MTIATSPKALDIARLMTIAPLPWRVGDDGDIVDANDALVLFVDPHTALCRSFNMTVANFVVEAVNTAVEEVAS